MKIRHLLLMGFAVLSTVELLAQKPECTPVKELQSLYENNPKFRENVDEMFANVQPLEDGSPNPWQGKGIDDLYDFFTEWFYFLPTAHDGLDRIIEFSFLYYKNPVGMRFILEEPGRAWSLNFIEERGKYMDSPESIQGISAWLSDPSLNNEEFVNPREGFASFNEFFTRDLKPGTRPIDGIDDGSILVSPADGVINMINNDLKLDSDIPTKAGMSLTLNTLLDNSEYAPLFVGGTALAVFLLPHNYHHYHAPISGTLMESKESVGDRLFGMPDILDLINDGNVAYNKDYSVFENFRHGYFIIRTEAYGHIAMVPIGLQTIGSVVFEENVRDIAKGNEVNINKGDRLGRFQYGGSTVLLLFEKGRFSSQKVRQGQQIGILSK